MPSFLADDGADLFYTDEGTGIPVIALAGLTRNSEDFNYVAPHLSGVRFIRLDYRGRGKSEWSGAESYTIPRETQDVLALMDYLHIEKAAFLGTSRGGLVAMTISAIAKNRISGVCLNDIGPVISSEGIQTIMGYVGRNPVQKTYAEAVGMRAVLVDGFKNVPQSRWEDEVRMHYVETPNGLRINYDPALRDAVLKSASTPVPDLWPLFDSLDGLPIALVRGENSNILTADTVAEMKRRRPDMIHRDVPDRGHPPFLDEPESIDTIHKWLEQLS